MKKICIVTATRAEYGLLRSVIKEFDKMSSVALEVVVTGAHLSPEFGLTFNEIINDGIKIAKKIEILVSADTPSAITKSMGLAMIGFADYFAESKPDLLIVLGDRYESLAIASAAMNFRIPIAHLYGGETTEGAVDESIRHAITKMSYLHFTNTDVYRNRVIQLGEHPQRVYSVGSLGIENIKNTTTMTKDELAFSLGFTLDKPFAVVTYHPVTLENSTSKEQIEEILNAIEQCDDYNYIFTKCNSDVDGRVINTKIDAFVANKDNCMSVESLGMKRYLTALSHCHFVLGNSSSGVVEAPSYKIPTINIGDRQKGRIQGESIINCVAKSHEIVKAIHLANDDVFRASLEFLINPYEKENTTKNIVEVIMDYLENNSLDLKKKFYDLDQVE